MSALFTPQKSFNKSALPPKPSTPKTCQKPTFSFENLQNTPINYSPRHSTPVNHDHLQSTSKTPLRSNNSSPSHRRSLDVLSHNSSEELKKFHEHIVKIESEKDRLRLENEMQAGLISDLEMKSTANRAKLKKKDEKIRFMTLLLKETEAQFKQVLENTTKDLEKIIQEQAMKIKELNETLKTQQKELSDKWEVEKNELASQISLLEKLNFERLQTQALSFTEKIAELSLSVEKLELSNRGKEPDIVDFMQKCEESCLELACSLGTRVKNEIFHLQGIIEGVCKEEDVSLSMILMTPACESMVTAQISDLPKILQHSLLSINTIRTQISDVYAERYGETCHIQ